MSTLLHFLPQLLVLLAVPVVGVLAKFGWDGIEKLIAIVKDPNAIPAIVKPFLVVVLSFAIGQLAAALHITLPGDVTLWTPDTVHTLMAAIFAVIVHLAQKRTGAAPPAPSALRVTPDRPAA